MIHLLWILPLSLLIFFLASPRYRGDIAETRVRRILAAGLEDHRYTVLNDVQLPMGGGTMHIDHLVVSRFGVFVIESQYAGGWVAGTAVQDRWKQTFLGRTIRFDNPVGINRRQQDAVRSLLELPSRLVHGLVVMVGPRGYKTEMPANVVQPEKLIALMRKRGQLLLEPEQAAKITATLNAARIHPDKGRVLNRQRLLQGMLLVLLAAGLYLAFGNEIRETLAELRLAAERRESPADFHPDGSRKTEQELWEDSLRCAWSADTGRCACYEPGGERVELSAGKCRELAERGSVLKQ